MISASPPAFSAQPTKMPTIPNRQTAPQFSGLSLQGIKAPQLPELPEKTWQQGAFASFAGVLASIGTIFLLNAQPTAQAQRSLTVSNRLLEERSSLIDYARSQASSEFEKQVLDMQQKLTAEHHLQNITAWAVHHQPQLFPETLQPLQPTDIMTMDDDIEAVKSLLTDDTTAEDTLVLLAEQVQARQDDMKLGLTHTDASTFKPSEALEPGNSVKEARQWINDNLKDSLEPETLNALNKALPSLAQDVRVNELLSRLSTFGYIGAYLLMLVCINKGWPDDDTSESTTTGRATPEPPSKPSSKTLSPSSSVDTLTGVDWKADESPTAGYVFVHDNITSERVLRPQDTLFNNNPSDKAGSDTDADSLWLFPDDAADQTKPDTPVTE